MKTTDANNEIRIGIIGNGNVGSHLKKALATKFGDKFITTLPSRQPEKIECEKYDIILIAVPDNAIQDVAQRLPDTEILIAHTSGSVDMDVLDRFPQSGVFYPLQTFTKDVTLDYSEIPFFIEGNTKTTQTILEGVASMMSNNVYHADSEERRKLHLASVFACNFVNHLYSRAWQILKDAGLPSESLIPLIKETASKLERIDPDNGQTGPAARKDTNVINRHIKMLQTHPDMAKEYEMLSENIIKRINR